MDKGNQDYDESLAFIREKLKETYIYDGTEDELPYADSVYKIIDNVVDWQLDHISDGELEDFYRVHMAKWYEDRHHAIEFNDAWMRYRESRDG